MKRADATASARGARLDGARRARWSSVLVASFAATFASCFGTSRAYPEKHYFAFDVANDHPHRQPASDQPDGETAVDHPEREPRHAATLRVERVRVAPRYQGRGLLYRTGDAEYQSDFYNEFLIPPAALLGEEVRRALSEAALFSHVVEAGSGIDPDVRLETAVNELCGDFRDADRPLAVIEVEFFLVRGDAEGVLLSRRMRRETPLSGASSNELVSGWNRGLGEILVELVRDLDGADLGEFGTTRTAEPAEAPR